MGDSGMVTRRTNLVIDEGLLKEAKRILEADTYSATVNFALAEVIRIAKVKSLTGLFGTGIWEGDLAEMRRDRGPARKRRKRA
ncbi:type II toxin-antitoxin system VapB family antitoxin [bacterium]|nr:type II toxin-antitoxin system VapB family antitoxin [bacterium]